MRPAFAVGLVFAGCCSNVIFLELLARWVTPAGRTKEAGGGAPPRAVPPPSRAGPGVGPPAPSVCTGLLGTPLSRLLSHPAHRPLSRPIVSQHPSRGTLRVFAVVTLFSHSGGWSLESFFSQGARGRTQGSSSSFLDPANAIYMKWAKLGLKKQSDLVHAAKKVSVVLKWAAKKFFYWP